MPQQQSNPPSGWTPVENSAAPQGWTPVDEQKPGWLDKDIPLMDEGQSAPRSFWGEVENEVAHPLNPATISGLQSVGRGVRGAISGAWNTVKTAADAWNNPKADVGDTVLPDPHLEQVPGAIKDINASADPTGTYAKAAQETAGQGAGAALTSLATEGVSRAPLGKVAKSAGVVAKPLGVFAEDLPVVGSVVKGAKAAGKVRGALSDIWGQQYGPNAGAPLPEAPPTQVSQASALFRGAKPGVDPSAGLGSIPVKPEPPATYPGAPLPETPDPALPKARSLMVGPQTVQDPAAGLGQIPVRGSIADSFKDPGAPLPQQPPEARLPAAFQPLPPKATPPVGTVDNPFQERGSIAGAMADSVKQPTPPVSRGAIGDLLNKGLNADPPLDPKVPLREQMPATRGKIAEQMKSAPAPEAAPATGLPEGHAPLDKSSWLKSYKYDPSAREFEYTTKTGQHYVRGDVDADVAAQFEKEMADSPGKAWNNLKDNPRGGVDVAKVLNGKRVALKVAQ